MMSFMILQRKRKVEKRKYEKTDTSYQILLAANGRVY